MAMQLHNTIAFVTGANRGIGRALVTALLARGAKKVYAGARDPDTARYSDPRVIPVKLDITDPAQVRAAAAVASDTRLLVNNAGVLASGSVLTAEPAQLQRDLDVNVHGPLAMVQAFAPHLVANQGAIANILSAVALANMPAVGGYSASKAAAWSITQALRGELGSKGVRVHAVFPGPVETEMSKSIDLPKAQPSDVANTILDGIAADRLDIAPDAMAADALATYLRDPALLARQFAGLA
jgi:NAD(P)-dependent dehydrogenase (short-subunit alcohol dehydrogenase family)